MKVLFYRRSGSEVGQRLCRKIESMVPEKGLQTFGALRDLILALQRPPNRDTVVVLLSETREEVVRLTAFRDLFADYRCILILPDSDPETISRGHGLYPRFLTHVDADAKDIAAVLAKMIRQGCVAEGIAGSPDAWDAARAGPLEASGGSRPGRKRRGRSGGGGAKAKARRTEAESSRAQQ